MVVNWGRGCSQTSHCRDLWPFREREANYKVVIPKGEAVVRGEVANGR